jgi:hypothetical protein
MLGEKKLINMSVLPYKPELEGTLFEGPIGVRQEDSYEMRSNLRDDIDIDIDTEALLNVWALSLYRDRADMKFCRG